MKHVTFIGFGEIGEAIAHLIGSRAEIRAWDKDPTKVKGGAHSMQEAVTGADIIFLCIPSWVIRKVASEISSLIAPTTVVISLAKGLEVGSLKTMDVVLQEALPKNQPSGVMGGPILAEELLIDLPGVGVIGASDPNVFSIIQPLFAQTALRLEFVRDSRAVAMASVLKNIYAVAMGIAEGFGWGWNGKGWLAAKSLNEMGDLMSALGGDLSVAMGTAGAGDFLATSMSPGSFNRETGRQIAITGECKKLSEGCRAITSVRELVGESCNAFVIFCSLDQIINQHADPKTIFQNLFTSV
jgi:glycerol-3-phosphate dehydrogenase (NAD(P)+)